MNLDVFRRALRGRHLEASGCARARCLGRPRDEARLDELDADLLTLEAAAGASRAFLGAAPESAARASARSCLAILLEEGALARLRPLDRAIDSALDRGRPEEVRELGEERRRALAREGSRAFEGPDAPTTMRELAAMIRGGTADDLAKEGERLLAGSSAIAEQLRDLGEAGGRGRASGTTRLERGGVPSALGMDARVDRIVDLWCGPAPAMSHEAFAPALRELGRDLDVDPGAQIEIQRLGGGAMGGPFVLEHDPPDTVTVFLHDTDGLDAFGAALAAWGSAASARMRSAALPVEHRLCCDPALGGALGVLVASLAPEHAQLRREASVARLRGLAREVASARLAAARAIEGDRVLSGRGSAGDEGERDAEAAASLHDLSGPSIAPPREPVLAAADRLRAHLLAPFLRERLRTRFGNLWYRERAAGRFLREACEPGGSLLIAEIFAGLSVMPEGAESVVDAWQDEIKRLR